MQSNQMPSGSLTQPAVVTSPSPFFGDGPIRGGLRISISTSTDNLVACSPITIFVNIENPFEKAIELQAVSSIFPNEFIDLDRLKAEERSSDNVIVARLGNLSRSGSSSVSIARDILTRSNPLGISAQAIVLGAEKLQQEKLGTGNSQSGLNPLLPPEPYLVLQPGNSTTRAFTVKTRFATQFNQSSFKMTFAIAYKVEGKLHSDTIEKVLNIRASTFAILLGTTIGALAGVGLQKNVLSQVLNREGVQADVYHALLISLFINCVFAIGSAWMSVVLLARKKDVQSLITIEDLWGGIALGFLVSYSGHSYFEQLVAGSTPPGAGGH